MTTNYHLDIAFAGTPDFAATTLDALVTSHHDVIAVYTQPDRAAGRGRKIRLSPVKTLALQHGLPVHQPQVFDDAETQTLADYRPDVMVVAAYGQLLPPCVLKTPVHGALNVHASLLPRWRGAAPIQRAILAGDAQTGVTIMQMNEGLDTGDMLAKRSCSIGDDDTAASLLERLAVLGARTLLEVLDQLCRNELRPETQASEQMTYARRLQKQEARITWTEAASTLCARVRGFNPWPVAYTELDGRRLRIWSATALSSATDTPVGTIVAATHAGIDVATGDGLLRLTQVQLPGGRKISAADLLNAHGPLVGSNLSGDD
jgi:methionyl-tRNA formyltransferase